MPCTHLEQVRLPLAWPWGEKQWVTEETKAMVSLAEETPPVASSVHPIVSTSHQQTPDFYGLSSHWIITCFGIVRPRKAHLFCMLTGLNPGFCVGQFKTPQRHTGRPWPRCPGGAALLEELTVWEKRHSFIHSFIQCICCMPTMCCALT